jgi:hypothetical protein
MATNNYVLITHNGQHGPVASYLAGDLERHGVRAILRPAAEPDSQHALYYCAALVVLVGSEADAGLARRDAERAAQANKPIFAARLAQTAGSSLTGLPIRTWTDAFGPNAAANVARLAGDLRGLSQPWGAQAPPVGQPPRQPVPPGPFGQPPHPGAPGGPVGRPPHQGFAPGPMAHQPHHGPAPRPMVQPPQPAAALAPISHPPQPVAAPAPVVQPPQPAPAPASEPPQPAVASAPPASRPAPPDIGSFETKRSEPGESVLAWIEADQGDASGIAVLTDRRLCFYGRGDAGVRLEGISVQTTQLRYHPEQEQGRMLARFENEDGAIAFSVTQEAGDGRLGNFLGNLKDLRDAQAALRDAGYTRNAGAQEEAPRSGIPAHAPQGIVQPGPAEPARI